MEGDSFISENAKENSFKGPVLCGIQKILHSVKGISSQILRTIRVERGFLKIKLPFSGTTGNNVATYPLKPKCNIANRFKEFKMNVLMLSTKLLTKRFAIVSIAFTAMLIAGSMESLAADGFWRSTGFRTGTYSSTPYRSSARVPTPRTGYGANFHRNFVIRQQQQRSRAGGSVISRGNILWRR